MKWTQFPQEFSRFFKMEGSMRLVFLSSLLIGLVLVAKDAAAVGGPVNDGVKTMTRDLYNVFAKTEGNVFFSPVCVHLMLSLLYQGAEGSTKNALATTTSVSEPELAAQGYKEIIEHLNHISDVKLRLANKAYVKLGYNLIPAFETTAKNKFDAQIDLLNFTNSGDAADAVNSWISGLTEGKITELVSPGEFDSKTKMVPISVIYFEGAWHSKFSQDATRVDRFFINPGDYMWVYMMHGVGSFNFKDDDQLGAIVVELPFKNDEVSMFVAVPKERYGIEDLERKIKQYGVNKIYEGMTHQRNIKVALPKFELETTVDLKGPLQDLGLGVIFDEDLADFSKLVDNAEELYVNNIKQRAHLRVNEEGVNAGAGSGGVLPEPGTPTLAINKEIRADHPFIVMIIEHDNVLFYGKVTRPLRSRARTEADSAE